MKTLIGTPDPTPERRPPQAVMLRGPPNRHSSALWAQIGLALVIQADVERAADEDDAAPHCP